MGVGIVSLAPSGYHMCVCLHISALLLCPQKQSESNLSGDVFFMIGIRERFPTYLLPASPALRNDFSLPITGRWVGRLV
jgi:hypothetical protein